MQRSLLRQEGLSTLTFLDAKPARKRSPGIESSRWRAKEENSRLLEAVQQEFEALLEAQADKKFDEELSEKACQEASFD